MIDVHHHYLPDRYVSTVGAAAIGAQGSSGRLPAWSVRGALDGMDNAGIRAAMLSISAPGFAGLDIPVRSSLARWCNEFAANIVTLHPGRFGSFAALPLPEVDAALVEVEFALDHLGADGVGLLSNYEGKYLGSPAFDPLYAELDRRAAVVFVHPTSPPHLQHVAGLSASTIEFPFDTARTVADIVFAQVPTRFPSIRWIFSHAGGVIPYLSGRIEALTTNNPALREKIPHGFSNELRKLYFDCALSYSQPTLDLLKQVAGVDRLLFGTDYPFGPRDQMAATVAAIDQLGWAGPEIRSLKEDNALALFSRFAR